MIQSFVSYVRSVFLQKDKGVFKFDDLPLEEFATSLGLAGAPQIKFTSKDASSSKKNAARSVQAADAEKDSSSEEEEEPTNVFGNKKSTANTVDDEEDAQPKPSKVYLSATKPYHEALYLLAALSHAQEKTVRTKVDRMFGRKNQGILSDHYNKMVDRQKTSEGDGLVNHTGDVDDDFLTLKRADHALEDNNDLEASDHLSKRKLKAGTSKKAIAAQRGTGNKLTFDDEGEAHALYELQTEADFAKAGDAKKLGQEFVDAERAALERQDVIDRAAAKERKREKKRKRKEAEVCTSRHSKVLEP